MHVCIISITPHQVQWGLPAAATPGCIMGCSPFPRGTTMALNDAHPSVPVKSAAPSLSLSPRQLFLLLFQESPLNVLPACGWLGDDSVAPSQWHRIGRLLRGSKPKVKLWKNETEMEEELQCWSSDWLNHSKYSKYSLLLFRVCNWGAVGSEGALPPWDVNSYVCGCNLLQALCLIEVQ